MNNLVLIFGLVASLILLGFAFAGPATGKAANRRLSAVKIRHSDSVDAKLEQQMRKAVAARRPIMFTEGTKMSVTDRLRLRLQQTGKKWRLNQYLYVSGGIFIAIFGILTIRGAPMLLALGGATFLALAVPHFSVSYLIRKRINDFTAKFPEAIELLVRGLKSGLPVGETLGVVAREIPGPVGEEFKIVTEKIKIGKTMEDALQDTAERLGTPEFQFFVITLAIQRETGGNLAETLSNLADVLRKRAQMKLKIRAMSSESKASAYIVGSLPFIVFALVWSVNPEYLGGFFVEQRLMIAGIVGLVWMSIGVGIMAKMVSFEI
ncbi:type II secretion system F family protein [uncultured Sphingorhabdus sp.]|uniref:type II secretion system F family protein n=1 Tax=uncultured Sphingorhabdus sp. TaxID=1686106 RepID=UPI0026214EBC|nr:type II secretion system F family protein [uncultured Sphingorhabdus sp.]HMS20122.1 type II secretion system F family protein [Sphingorhabdus sp.]